jgi:Tfp pilus assembly protein PilV
MRAKTCFRMVAGFTIIEVAISATVMALAISSSLIVLQQGMRAIDNARYYTLAGQILQSQIEKLRLLTWQQLVLDTTNGPFTTVTTKSYYISPTSSWFAPDVATAASAAQLNNFKVSGAGNRCLQTIALPSTVDGATTFDATMRILTLTATWTGSDGRTHSLSYTTRYGRYGLSDFFWTSH